MQIYPALLTKRGDMLLNLSLRPMYMTCMLRSMILETSKLIGAHQVPVYVHAAGTACSIFSYDDKIQRQDALTFNGDG